MKSLKKHQSETQSGEMSAEINYEELEQLIIEKETMFEWQNGPLVESMVSGGLFMIDEISLADDSVLERLNSVLE